jgi:hypothetical protein
MSAIEIAVLSVWLIMNPGSQPITVTQQITNTAGFSTTIQAVVPAQGQVEVHVKDIGQVPQNFRGYLTLSARRPFSAYLLDPDHVSGQVPVDACRVSICSQGGW